MTINAVNLKYTLNKLGVKGHENPLKKKIKINSALHSFCNSILNLKLSKTSSAVLKPANATKSHINISCNQTLNIKITGEVRHFYIVAKVRSIIVGQTDDTGGTLDHLQSYIPLTTKHKKN